MTNHPTGQISLIAQIANHIRDLTRPHQHVETYAFDLAPGFSSERNHRVVVPALLAQLGADTRDTSIDAGDGPRPGYASRPPARVDAVDTGAHIDLAAARWIRDLTGEWSPPKWSTARVIQHLGALAASADHVQQAAIARDIRGWWIAARIVTGWDSPAWAPDATCPACEERGTLRVRLADQSAICSAADCRVWWDGATIGLLADHIRAETLSREGVNGRPPACQVLGDYDAPDLAYLCRVCGSARCIRAMSDRLRALAEAPGAGQSSVEAS